jgi:hypothetical protein
VWTLETDVEFMFWWRARLGFRFFLGGGYLQAPPLITVVSTGFGKFGGGVTVRF